MLLWLAYRIWWYVTCGLSGAIGEQALAAQARFLLQYLC